MPRLLFEKKGTAVWISHLDLMRLFQRAFKRAGLQLTHTQGYNPRPSVSIALPLSVGTQSGCELLDFDLDGDAVPTEEIRERLNRVLVDGIRVLEVYEAGRKLRDLALLQCRVSLCYDSGVSAGAEEQIRGLFARQSLLVPKRTKNGVQEQDIIPMIKSIDVTADGENRLLLDALVCCQDPTLNPAQLTAAIALHLPELAPSFSGYQRVEIYDMQKNVFR